MSDCINRECSGKKAGVCLNDFPGVKCYGYEPPRKTNADRIRSMSDEELADQFTKNGVFLCPAHNPNCLEADCRECFLDWMKQEAPDTH